MIAIPEEISRRFVPRKRLAQLLRGPRRGRMVGDGDVHDAPVLVGEDDRDKQKAARRSRLLSSSRVTVSTRVFGYYALPTWETLGRCTS